MKFYSITNMMADYQFPVPCDHYEPIGDGGWIGFFADDRLVIAISPEYFFFREIDEEEYYEALDTIAKEEEKEGSNEE